MPTSRKVVANASSNTTREEVNSNGKVGGGLGGGGPSAGVSTNQQNNFIRVVDAQENNISSVSNTLASPSKKKAKFTTHHNNVTSSCKPAAQPPANNCRSRRLIRKLQPNSNAKQLNSNGTPQSKSIAIKSPAQPPSSTTPSFPIFEDATDNSKPGGGAAADSAISKISDEDIDDTIINGEDSSAALIEEWGCMLLEEKFAQESTTSTSTYCKTSDNPKVQKLVDTLARMQIKGEDIVKEAINISTASADELKKFGPTLQKRLNAALDMYHDVKVDPSRYNAQVLEDQFNLEAGEDFDELSNYMDSKKLNLSHKFSRGRRLLIWMAYSPDGTMQIGYHCMPFWQCCIRIEIQSVPRYLQYLVTDKYPENTTYTDKIGCMDRVMFTAKKFDDKKQLDAQYETDANAIGLNRIQSFLYSDIIRIKHDTLAIVDTQNADYQLPTIIASSSTASDICGWDSIDRYSVSGSTIFAIHAQGKVMGHGKKDCYKKKRAKMNSNTLIQYARVLDLTEDKLNKVLSGEIEVPFYENFGQGQCDNDTPLDVYSILASKVVREDGRLDLTSLTVQEEAVYEHQVSVHGDEKVLNLLHRFNTNHKLRTLAAKFPENIPDTLNGVPTSLRSAVMEASKVLNTKPRKILSKLKNIKRAQVKNGELLKLRSELAATLDVNGDLPDDSNIRAKFVEFTNLIKIKTAEVALQQLRNTRAAQDDNDRLVLMTKLAALLDVNRELPSQYNSDFDKFVQLTKLKNPEVALQQLRNTRAAQESYADGGTLLKMKSGKTTYRTNAEIVDLLMQHADLDELRSCNSAYSLRYFIMNKDETLKNVAWGDDRWEDQNESEGIKSLLSKALDKKGIKKKEEEVNRKKNVIQIDRDLINSDPNALSNIESPGPNDVMTGRGRGPNDHPGNIKLRRIIEKSKPTYKAATKTERGTIASNIVHGWRALNPPGRFLKKNEETCLWDDIGDDEANKKCTAKLREKDTVRESKKRKATEDWLDKGDKSPTEASPKKEQKKMKQKSGETATQLTSPNEPSRQDYVRVMHLDGSFETLSFQPADQFTTSNEPNSHDVRVEHPSLETLSNGRFRL